MAEPSRDEALAALARELTRALDGRAVPQRAVERAAADALYLHALVGRRTDPDAVTRLLEGGEGPAPKWAPPASLALALQAGAALARWSAAGFGRVDDETLERRRAACRACPHLREPGAILMEIFAAGRGGKVCGLCSCAIDKKAMLPTESCPDRDPGNATRTRWGEMFVG